MDYFFSQIILDLQERIKTEIPEFKYIDQDIGQLGQIGNDDDKPPLAYPALLIDFPETSYSNMSAGAQLGTVPVSFQLIFSPYSQTWHQSPAEVRQKGLEYLDIEQKLFNALQNWSLDYFSPMIRTSVKSQNNNDVGLRVRTMIFTTEYEDYSVHSDEYKDVEFIFKGNINDD